MTHHKKMWDFSWVWLWVIWGRRSYSIHSTDLSSQIYVFLTLKIYFLWSLNTLLAWKKLDSFHRLTLLNMIKFSKLFFKPEICLSESIYRKLHYINSFSFGVGQGGLACCDSRGRRVGHDWATELNSFSKHRSISL